MPPHEPQPDGKERFELTLIDLGGSPPVEVRLRHVLKRLLRSFGFKCEKAVALPARDDVESKP